MLSLAEKGRPTLCLCHGGKVSCLFLDLLNVESFLDVVVSSRAPWERMRTSQPCTVTSLRLNDCFLEKKRKEREDSIWTSLRREVASLLGSRAAVLCCASEPPAMLTNMNYINVVKPKLILWRLQSKLVRGGGSTFSLQLVSLKMIWRVCLYLVMEHRGRIDACGNEGCSGRSGRNIRSSRESCASGLVHLATVLSCSTCLKSAQHCSYFSLPHLLWGADKHFWGMM